MRETVDSAKCAKKLCRVELFSGLNEDQLMAVANLCELKTYRRGDPIMREGTEAHGMYILLSGEVSISKILKLPHLEHSNVEDRVLTKITADTSPALGETALIGESTRSATVRCIDDCTVYRLESVDLINLCNKDPQISSHVFQRLSKMLYHRLQQTSTDVVKLTAALMFALEE